MPSRPQDAPTVPDLEAELSRLPLDQRLLAIAADVRAGEGRYESIPAHELLALMGVHQVGGGSWSMYREVPECGVNEVIEHYCDDPEEIAGQIGLPDPLEDALKRAYRNGRWDLALLTADEARQITKAWRQTQLYDGAEYLPVYAYLCLRAPDGTPLYFMGRIEDDGGCIELQTPYQLGLEAPEVSDVHEAW